MPADGRGLDSADIALAAAAVDGRVGVEDLLPEARARHADPVVRPRDRREIARDQDDFVGLIALPEQANDALVRVVYIGPGKASGGTEVEPVQGRLAAIGTVQVADPAPQTLMK